MVLGRLRTPNLLPETSLMADKPTDDATTAPPPRRAPRTKVTSKPKRATAAKSTRRVPSKAGVSDALVAPAQAVKKATTAVKRATTKATTQAKPKAKAAVKKVVVAEQTAAKSNVGKGFLIGGALAAIAATIAGVFGRKKIADATAKSIDTVMGKPDEAAGQPTMSAD